MTTHTHDHIETGRVRHWPPTLLCLVGAALALAPVPVMGYGLFADTGAEVTDLLRESPGRWQGAAFLAVLGSAALLPAAVLLGKRIGGTAGTVLTISGSAFALLLGAYYASFGAGATVAVNILDDAGPGLGEATLAMANMTELARYAPTLSMVVAAVVARKVLPKAVSISAGGIAVMVLVPMLTWIAAIVAPAWLGVAAAAYGGDGRSIRAT